MTPSFEVDFLADEARETLCDYCEEPITLDRPGSNWLCRMVDPEEFPYAGRTFSVVLHDDSEVVYMSCTDGYFISGKRSGSIDSEVVVP